MAAFIAMTSWQGEFTDEYFAQPAPDPAAFGMPADDDGSRDDPLLSDRSWAVSGYRPDVDALAAAPTRVVIAVGEESEGTFTGRTSVAIAALLGQQATVFPSHHGGFLGGEFGYAGQPEAFAQQAPRRARRRQLTTRSRRRAGVLDEPDAHADGCVSPVLRPGLTPPARRATDRTHPGAGGGAPSRARRWVVETTARGPSRGFRCRQRKSTTTPS